MKILLAHGILGFGSTRILESIALGNYFNGVAAHLEGHKVDQPSVNRIGSIKARGDELKREILGTALGPGERLHVIAHSMGGLDMRYALSDSRVADRVATLVTIGTPHKGSPVADAIFQRTGPLFTECPPFLRKELESHADGLRELTTPFLEGFNRDFEEPKGRIRYIAVAGDAAAAGSELLLFRFAAVLGGVTGETNDGVVTKSSALRDDYEHRPLWPSDHAGEIGWTSPLIWRRFFPATSHLARYDELVREIANGV